MPTIKFALKRLYMFYSNIQLIRNTGPVGFEPTLSGSEAKTYGFRASLNERGLVWNDLRERFIEYLKSEDYSVRNAKSMVRYLDRYVSVLRRPYDIIEMFSKVERG